MLTDEQAAGAQGLRQPCRHALHASETSVMPVMSKQALKTHWCSATPEVVSFVLKPVSSAYPR